MPDDNPSASLLGSRKPLVNRGTIGMLEIYVEGGNVCSWDVDL
jgi:hypothetical protein